MTASIDLKAAGLTQHFGWVEDKPVQRILGVLEKIEADCVRFVGGCVRDSLFGETPKDIDLATTLKPDQVIAALKGAGLGVAPTGIEHGTVTAIAYNKGIEVTTLRADVSTDGRRANVAFTRDWVVDARRRDFTMNALYLTPQLVLFDPVGGMDDIGLRRVRFIGEAADRIREDYLRILRFFRFSARFSATFDELGLAACAALKDGIRRLSAERIGDEMSKLLSLPAPQAAVSAMAAKGVLAEVWPERPAIETLARLKMIDPAAPAPLGLAALFGAAGEGIDARLRLSNAQSERRRYAVVNARQIDPAMDERAAKILLYRMGAAAWNDACLLAEAIFLADTDTPQMRAGEFERVRSLPLRWPPPRLPFAGKDALAAGVPEGPRISAVIKAAEARWIGEDFPPRARALAIFAEETAAILKG